LLLDKLSSEPCASCSHSLLSHIFHCEKVSDNELNRLVNTAIDVESLILFLHIEPDADTKHVYFYLYKLLRKSLASMISPTVESPLGNPPFEEPSILKVWVNDTVTVHLFCFVPTCLPRQLNQHLDC